MPSPIRQQRDRERRERTRQALLDAAEQVFSDNGYHATLISDIVGAAGVGQGTFYRNFVSKREIFVTLFERFVDRLFAEFTGMSVNLPRSEQEYRLASVNAIRRVASIIAQERSNALLFLREGPSIDRDFAAMLDGVCDRFAALAQFYLEHAIERGFARPCDGEIVSQSLVGIGLRILNLWLSGRVGDGPERLIDEVIELAFSGFGPGGLAIASAGGSSSAASSDG